MAIREGRWDCQYCGKEGNRGPDKHCQGCGAPRDANVEFYLPDDAAEVTDAKALEQARRAPDWHCTYCGGDNPSDAKFCGGCGAGVDGTEPRRQVKEILDAKQAPAPKPAPTARGRGMKAGVIAGAVLAAIVAALYFFVFRTHEETLEVTGHTWERTIEIEKFKTVTESAWEGEVPGDARILSRHQEVYKQEKIQAGTKHVKTGKRDLGNGYFEDIYEDRPVYEEKPIYRDKVSYQVDRWKPDRTLKEDGRDLTPRWPQVTLEDKEREGTRKETYTILFKSSDGKERDWTAKTEQEWTFYQDGSKVKAKVRTSGGIAELEKPAEKP